MKLVTVLSGGMDSATALAMVMNVYTVTELHAVTFSYGQSHEREVKCALDILGHYGKGITSEFHQIDLTPTMSHITVKGSLTKGEEYKEEWKVPDSYVPGRNFIFLSYAIGLAVAIDCNMVVCGIHAGDSPYPDCREGAVHYMQNAFYSGTPNGVKLKVPLLHMRKKDIAKKALELGVPLELTNTCYFPLIDGKPCLVCDSCKMRVDAFKTIGEVDPLSPEVFK